jgi:hypothetical protein
VQINSSQATKTVVTNTLFRLIHCLWKYSQLRGAQQNDFPMPDDRLKKLLDQLPNNIVDVKVRGEMGRRLCIALSEGCVDVAAVLVGYRGD